MLKYTVNRAQNGLFGENLSEYPGSPASLLELYRSSENLLVRDNLLKLLLLSPEGQTAVRENLAAILSRDLNSIPVLPTELEQESELSLLLAVLGEPTAAQLGNLDLLFSNGISIPLSELLSSFKDYEKLSRFVFPYSGRLSRDLGVLGEIISECRSTTKSDSCLRGVGFVNNRFQDTRQLLARELFMAAVPNFNSASASSKLTLLRDSSNLPLGFFTPDVLNGFVSLLAGSSNDPEFRNEICRNLSLIDVPLSLDSRIQPLVSSICERSRFSYFSVVALSLCSLVLLFIGKRLSAQYNSQNSSDSRKLSGQLIKLSESYRGEREELARFFGISEQATAIELNASFKKLAKSTHPDSPTGSERAYCDLTAKFQRAKEIVVTNY